MAGLFRGVLREIDGAMENTFEGYLAANRNFAQATHNIEAIQASSDAAMRGRTEDTVPAFQRLTPQSQRAFRAGYVDPFIEQRKAQRCARMLGGQLGFHLLYPDSIGERKIACQGKKKRFFWGHDSRRLS
jgi:hypothetical protein